MLSKESPSFARHPHFTWDELRRALISEMSALRRELDPEGLLTSAVVAFPGPVDPAGRVLAAPTLWGALGPYPYALATDLCNAWPHTRISVMNDVTAAGYRYMRTADDEFCIVTLSTGIGNNVFVLGRPLTGAPGLGGEIGHFQVDPAPGAALCDCGGRGHLSAIASGRGTVARARAEGKRDPVRFGSSLLASKMGLSTTTLTAEALAAAYGQLDDWATELIQYGVDALAGVFAAIHLAIGVERFVLVGGFTFGLGERFRRALEARANERCWDGRGAALAVTLGQPDGECALIGGGRADALGLLNFARLR